LVDEPRASYAITLKLLSYVDARDEDAITLASPTNRFSCRNVDAVWGRHQGCEALAVS
jgi:hypothetical protein